MVSTKGKLLMVTFMALVAVAAIVVLPLTLMRKNASATPVTSDEVVVRSECGDVVGRRVKTSDGLGASYVFTNIPYAEPPKRWSFPILRSQGNKNCWKGQFVSNESSIICKQRKPDKARPGKYIVYGTEDCLYLTIHSPNLKGRLPVMVWIHGGFLFNGHKDAPGYSTDADFVTNMSVVGVNVNYRLNVFGFLTMKELWKTSGKEEYGNYGFADQITALEWVQKNIAFFGGNPDSVTIFGESAGGSSMLALISSPLANGLFHRAIPMSGAPVWIWNCSQAAALNDVVLDNSGCRNLTTAESRKDCLLKLTSDEALEYGPWFNGPNWDQDYMLRISAQLPVPDIHSGPIACLDPVVFPTAPVDLKSVSFDVKTPIKILIGNTAQELASFPVNVFSNWSALYEYTKSRMDRFNERFFPILWNDLYKNISSADNVTGTPQFTYETMATDMQVTCPTSHLASEYSKSSKHVVYRYFVEHRPSVPILGSQSSMHVWDAFALFGYKALQAIGFVPATHDLMFEKAIRDIFRDFAGNGSMPQDWKVASNVAGVFLNEEPWLGLPKAARERQCGFWIGSGFFNYGWSN